MKSFIAKRVKRHFLHFLSKGTTIVLYKIIPNDTFPIIYESISLKLWSKVLQIFLSFC